MRLLGLDYGDRRIGIALGDTDSKIATPWQIVEGVDFDVQVKEIQEIMIREKADAVVVGIPYSMSGEEGAQAEKTRQFIDVLRSKGIVIHEADERLSSKLADTLVRDVKRPGPRDDLAAASILQMWLERYGVSS
ncbi:MAG: Holliday junction resolvase RuvX [bacterium]|nr:Holliday junction resolvase RuvX [bacterium]